MAYVVIRKVKGSFYAYRQESYRDGATVRTRTVDYLGAVSPAVAEQYRTTRAKVGKAQAQAFLTEKIPPPATVAAPIILEAGVTLPPDIETHGISPTALRGTFARHLRGLRSLGLETPAPVSIKYGSPNKVTTTKNGYTVQIERNPKRNPPVNKGAMWRNYRHALACSQLDALKTQNKPLFDRLERRLSKEHKKARRATLEALTHAQSPVQGLAACASFLMWSRLPHSVDSVEYGASSLVSAGNWQAEAVEVWADCLKNGGFDELKAKISTTKKRLNGRITRKKKELQRGGFFARLGRKLSGRERRLLREILKVEAQKRALAGHGRRVELLASFAV